MKTCAFSRKIFQTKILPSIYDMQSAHVEVVFIRVLSITSYYKNNKRLDWRQMNNCISTILTTLDAQTFLLTKTFLNEL